MSRKQRNPLEVFAAFLRSVVTGVWGLALVWSCIGFLIVLALGGSR